MTWCFQSTSINPSPESKHIPIILYIQAWVKKGGQKKKRKKKVTLHCTDIGHIVTHNYRWSPVLWKLPVPGGSL